MKKTLATIAAAAVLAIPLLTASPASAYGWNNYDTTLPEFVTGPTPFEVVVTGDLPVCEMTYEDTTLTTAPWVFTYDPEADDSGRVAIETCDGYGDTVRVFARTPFSVDGKFVYKGEWDTTDTISVRNHTNSPASVTVTKVNGETVAAASLEPDSSTDIKLPIKGLKSTVVYNVTITGENGMTQTARVLAPKGWTPLMENGAAFAPCSALKWTYDKSGARPGSKKITQDIEGGLNRLSKVTGLKFSYTDNPEDADIVYNWDNMGKGGPAATGGYSWSSSGPSKGEVTFNNKNYWTGDNYLGFASGKRANGYGPAGRGWLVIHETMHAIGFGHVDNKESIMHPTNTGQSKFTKGDREGLESLYPSAGCKA